MSIALVLCVLTPAAALRGSGQKSELLTDMRPEVVSKLLSEVTDKWVMDFVSVKTNASDQATAYSNMEKSCLTVTKSIIAGSDGDEDRVAEYMQEVCSRSSSKMCTSFAKGMDDAMIGDANFNRNNLKVTNFCKAYWNSDVQTAANEKKVQMEADEKAAAEKKAAEEKAAAEQKEAEEKAAAEKKAADEKAAAEAAEKAAADKKAADEKAAADKKAAEEKAAAEAEKNADEQRAQAEKLRGSIRAKMENLTAAIEKTSSSVEKTYNSTEDNVQKLLEHAQQAMKLATKKEADALQKAKEEKEAKEAAEKKAQEAAAAQQKNTTAVNDTMPAEVEDMMKVNISQAEETAKAEGDAKADAIIAKATQKVDKNVTQKKA